MNCHEAERQIFAERDGALGTDQRAALAQHVAGCATCRRTRDGLEAAIALWRSESQAAPVPDSERAWQDLRRELRQARAPATNRHWLAWVGAPLAAAAAIAVAFYVNTPRADSGAPVHRASREVARAEYVEVPNRNASTVVFVDEKSGWLVVMASDGPARL
ncbi:MAG: zf-HC2 domain-containing protein [Opitutaceae bacterium]|nr:zf-HC2 domain-containing protein [Opitutaceae bacterium]